MAVLPAQRVRKDRRTKTLIKRLRQGDIALIHHVDLDGTAARALVDCKVSAVINAAKSISGRYPNGGPRVLMDAGIPLLDNVGDESFEAIAEGAWACLDGGALQLTDGRSFTGDLLSRDRIDALLEDARANLSDELDRFARNTLEFLSREKSLLFDPVDVPQLKTRFRDRHVLIVVRGEGFKEDLAMLRAYLNDLHPILLAVDGGADALIEAKIRPDVILGDMDSISDAALACGAEVVVHAYAREDRRDAPGLERVRRLGLTAHVYHSPGTSEDAAMLLADALGAQLIVAVGTHFSLVEFLDKGRNGMASTFLTRLRIGSKLVDAKGIGRLWAGQRLTWRDVGLIFCAGLAPLIVVLLVTDSGYNVARSISVWLRMHLVWLHMHLR